MMQSFVNHVTRKLELWIEHRRLRLEEKQIKREEELEAMNRALEDRRMKIIQHREERDKQIITQTIDMDDIFEDMVTIDDEEEEIGNRRLRLKQTEIIVSHAGRRVFPLSIYYNDEPIEVCINGLIVHDEKYALAIRDNHIFRIVFNEGLDEGSHILITLIEASSNAMLYSLPILKKRYSMTSEQGRVDNDVLDSQVVYNDMHEFMHRSWSKMIGVDVVGKDCGYFFDKKYLYILTMEFNHEKITKFSIDEIINGIIHNAAYFSVRRHTLSRVSLYIEGEFLPHMHDDEVQFTGQQSIELKGY